MLDRAAGKLASLVAAESAAEMNDRVLQGLDPLVVSWRPRVSQDADAEATRGVPSGDTRVIAPLARFVRRGRGLVILGPGGSGKTTLAAFLMGELLADRSGQSRAPVPVMIPAESFRPEETVREWLKRTLIARYPALRDARTYGPGAISDLVDQDRVLPVIDGLDDLAPGPCGELLKALRRAFGQGHQLIVTCQPAEYHQAVTAVGRVLTGAAVIELLPVAAEDAARFLERGASGTHARDWKQITAKICAQPDGPLATALASPLMTGLLLRSAYGQDTGGAGELTACTSLAAVENRILGALFITAFSESATSQYARPRNRWDAQSADRWLTFLATHLARCSSNDLDWPRLRQAIGAFTTPLRWATLGGLLAFFLAGTTFGLSRRLTVSTGQALFYGLAHGLDAACVVGAIYLLADVSCPPGIRVPAWLGWLRRRTRKPLSISAVAPAAYAIESGIRDGVGAALTHGAPAGVRAGLTGLAVNWLIATALLFLAAKGNLIQVADNPVYFSLRMPGRAAVFGKAMAAGLAWGSCLGLAVGFGIEVASGLLSSEHPRWYLGVPAGAVIGAAFAVVRWGRTPVASAPAASPTSVLRTDRALVLLLAMVFLIAIPGIFAAAFTDHAAQYALYGLGVGITIWLAIALSHAWPQYVITTVWLAARGQLPWRLASFLEEALRLQILRQRGVAYQFRHARLRDHLADARRG